MSTFRKSLIGHLCAFQILAIGVLLIRPAIVRAQGTQSPPSNPSCALGIQILTPTEGTNFNEFIHGIAVAIKGRCQANFSKSASAKEKGVVFIRFKILKDGSLGEQAPKLERGSRRNELDNIALNAVAAAAPYEHLPESYDRNEIELRVVFLYNIPPDKVLLGPK
jgi:outer membrane biosynthesis protein TonB